MQPTTDMIPTECIVKDESSRLLLQQDQLLLTQPNERKCCRICLDDEGDDGNDNINDPMIAPCMCKGNSKWVHRSCLDSWRMNEPDRAFAQCTECRYTYRLIAVSSNPQKYQSPVSTPSSESSIAALSDHPTQLPAASSF